MTTLNIEQAILSLVISIILCLYMPVFSAGEDPNDPNYGCLVQLGPETLKVAYLAESLYWPDFDFKNVISNISEPNPIEKAEFTKLITQIMDPNYLPAKLPEKVRFLKRWRGEDRGNFVMQYEKGPYLIRVKNQKLKVVTNRVWTSYWITIAIQLKEKATCVNKSDLNTIFNLTDRFIVKKLNSKAQDYSGIKNIDGTNMNKPIFKKMDKAYFVTYPVQSSKPDVDAISIWTDGVTVIINLQERRKENI